MLVVKVGSEGEGYLVGGATFHKRYEDVDVVTPGADSEIGSEGSARVLGVVRS